MIYSIYHKTIHDFLTDLKKNRFIEQMKNRAQICGTGVRETEVSSWVNNANALKEIVKNVSMDSVIAFEVNSPVGGRIDCMLFGEGNNGKKNIIHIELKQWSNKNIKRAAYDNNLFEVYIEKRPTDETHPCYQAENYDIHLRNFIKLFDDEEQYNLVGLSYCYNYDSEGGNALLFEDKDLIKRIPLYTKDKENEISTLLADLLSKGGGEEVFQHFENSDAKPTKNLIDATAKMFEGKTEQTEFRLLEGQDASCQRIFNEIDRCSIEGKKSVIIVKGGPGTGKTVIALHILSKLAKEGKYKNFFYATRATALRKSLRAALMKNKATRSSADLLQYIFNFKPNAWKESEIDVLLVDEAHRVSRSSNSDKERVGNTVLRQTLSLIYCSKVTVFFIDDRQAVNPNEIGTSSNISYTAENYQNLIKEDLEQGKEKIDKLRQKLDKKKAKLGDEADFNEPYRKEENTYERFVEGISKINSSYDDGVKVITEELKAQFRCNGSDTYLHWIDNVFNDIDSQKVIPLKKADYDIRIFDDPTTLYSYIKSLSNETPKEGEEKVVSRMVAGWCWPWKTKLADNGDLLKEVEIGDSFKESWETRIQPASEFRHLYAPSAELWAFDPRGVNQIGCNPSSQGFDFEYVGVILGPDITVKDNGLVAVPNKNYDGSLPTEEGKELTTLIRNIYRVLMTRGKKGCYIYCCDPKVADYFRKYLPKD